jgi:hypothetical protein
MCWLDVWDGLFKKKESAGEEMETLGGKMNANVVPTLVAVHLDVLAGGGVVLGLSAGQKGREGSDKSELAEHFLFSMFCVIFIDRRGCG